MNIDHPNALNYKINQINDVFLSDSFADDEICSILEGVCCSNTVFVDEKGVVYEEEPLDKKVYINEFIDNSTTNSFNIQSFALNFRML
ncbi:hypothetical protein QTN25_001583 [Entamoeba marina]